VLGRGVLSVIYRLGALPAVRAHELADVFGLQAGRKFACCQSLVHAVAAGSVLPLWRVVDFCANRFVLRFRSSNKGATPWLRKQRKRKRRRRSNFALRRQWASQLRARRMSSAAGHFQPPFACAQPPFACAIGILNGVAGWFRAHSRRAAGRTLAKTAIPAKPSECEPRLIPVLSVAQIPTPDFPAKPGSRAIAAPCMESTD
jgi:hypothetical protein